jgi:hypothetical protein
VSVHDSLHEGKANAGTRKFLFGMQSLEYTEQFPAYCMSNPTPLSASRIDGLGAFACSGNFDPGLFSRASVLGGIRQQMDPDQTQQRAISMRRAEGADLRGLAAVGCSDPTLPDFGHQQIHVYHSANGCFPRRERAQESIDEPTHLAPPSRMILSRRLPSSSKGGEVFFLEYPAKTFDCAQRRAQIMGNRITESFRFPKRRFQFFVRLPSGSGCLGQLAGLRKYLRFHLLDSRTRFRTAWLARRSAA